MSEIPVYLSYSLEHANSVRNQQTAVHLFNLWSTARGKEVSSLAFRRSGRHHQDGRPHSDKILKRQRPFSASAVKDFLTLELYMGTSPIRNHLPLGAYSSIYLGPCGSPRGVGVFKRGTPVLGKTSPIDEVTL